MIDDRIGILRRGNIDQHRGGVDHIRQFAFGIPVEHRRHGVKIGRIVRQARMRKRVGHALDFGGALLRQFRRRVEIQVVGDRAGHFQPAEERFGVTGFYRDVARRRRRAGRLRLGLLFLATVEFLIRRDIFQNTVIPAVDDEDRSFLVDGDAVGKIQLSFRFTAIAPGAEKGAVPIEFLDAVITCVDDVDVA